MPATQSLDNQTPAPASTLEFTAFVVVMGAADAAFLYGLIEKAAVIVAQVPVVFGG